MIENLTRTTKNISEHLKEDGTIQIVALTFQEILFLKNRNENLLKTLFALVKNVLLKTGQEQIKVTELLEIAEKALPSLFELANEFPNAMAEAVAVFCGCASYNDGQIKVDPKIIQTIEQNLSAASQITICLLGYEFLEQHSQQAISYIKKRWFPEQPTAPH